MSTGGERSQRALTQTGYRRHARTPAALLSAHLMDQRTVTPTEARHRHATVLWREPSRWFRSRRRSGRLRRFSGEQLVSLGTMAIIFTFVALTAVAPPAPATAEDLVGAYNKRHAQTLAVPLTVEPAAVLRDGYSTQPGIPQLARHGTNYDWAKIVLMYGEWPVTDNNVTVITRWMRQENGPNNWWNRNNPLNNGWGSGGGGGLGSYPNLLVAAQNAAKALHTHPGYASIIAGFAADAATASTEHAIWFSPWASGHYANGSHWHYTPVKEYTAPVGAWG